MLTTDHKAGLSEARPNIQIILSKSYSFFLFSFAFGLILDVFAVSRINSAVLNSIGLGVILLASVLIYWAQTVNKRPHYKPDGTRDFSRGPYAFSRHPTYLGLFLVMLGAGFAMSSYVVIAVVIVSFIISTQTFMVKEEARHIQKYGRQYLDYMKKTRKVL